MTITPNAPLPEENVAPRRWELVPPLVAVVFGLMTIRAGGSVLFGDEAARRAVGNVVSFVLWFNFVAGFAYVAAGIGLWRRVPWSTWLSFAILAGTLAVFGALGLHVLAGGPYEVRTLAAMTVRTLVWLALAFWAHRKVGRAGAAVRSTAAGAPPSEESGQGSCP